MYNKSQLYMDVQLCRIIALFFVSRNNFLQYAIIRYWEVSII